MGAFINIRIIETDHRRLVFGNRRKFGSQRGVHLVQPFCHRLLHTDTEHLYRHRIQLRHFIVHCQDNNPHWRCLNQQIQEVILLAHAQPFILELLHHSVKDIHNAVCFVLPYPAETTTEILLAQQLHTAAYGVHRFHYLIIEYYQIDKDKPDEPLQYVQIQRRLPTQQIYQHSTQTEQKKDKYEEKEFYAHGT